MACGPVTCSVAADATTSSVLGRWPKTFARATTMSPSSTARTIRRTHLSIARSLSRWSSSEMKSGGRDASLIRRGVPVRGAAQTAVDRWRGLPGNGAGDQHGVSRTDELEAAREQAEGCRRCDLWRNATQTVFGEGTIRARAMLVGEQPGDVEDEEGRPFVGPAGALLRKVMGEVGLREREVYLTNAVKHFKWR